MPISSPHPSYAGSLDQWIDCRAAYDGQRAVKALGERFLPKLKGQNQEEYDAYRGRALFYSITSKTISALVGMALDKPATLEYPDKMKPYFEDQSGTQFYELLSAAVGENLLMARFGVLVDRPVNGGAPFVSMYPTESILNWRTSEDGKYEMVVLKEGYYEQSSSDEYVQELKTRYRKLEIIDGRLVISIWSESSKGNFAMVGAPTTIQNTGVAMDSIPFFCVTPTGLGIEPGKSPVADIVDINMSHYRTSADLEHGRHFTGLPTPYVIGADAEGKMHIGSLTAWIIPDASAKVGFLEFTGQGLQSLEKALAEKQAQLASMSARLIDNSTRGSEAAETVRLRYMSETASLRTIVRAVEALLNAVYNAIAKMEGLGDNVVHITLYKDFLSNKMSAAELKVWTEAYLSGAVTKEMYLHALRTGDVLPPPGAPIGELKDPPLPAPPKPTQPTE